MKRFFPESELIINADGSCFHLHVRPEQLADRIILVSDPASVDAVASLFDNKECEISSREFHTITGLYCNLDMESASIIGMASLLGHRAISCRLVKSNRLYQSTSSPLEVHIDNLYKKVLDRI